MTSSSSVARRVLHRVWFTGVALIWLVVWLQAVGDGCAHLRQVDQSCRQLVTPSLATKVSEAFDLAGFEARLEQLAVDYTLCAVNVAAQDLVDRGGAAAPANPSLQLAPAALSPAALRLERARAWLATHPSTGAPPGT